RVRDAVSRRALTSAGYFDPIAVERLVQKCRRQSSLGFRDDAALCGILSTQLWHRVFVEMPHRISALPQSYAVASGETGMLREIERKAQKFIEDNFLFRDDRTGISAEESLLD